MTRNKKGNGASPILSPAQPLKMSGERKEISVIKMRRLNVKTGLSNMCF